MYGVYQNRALLNISNDYMNQGKNLNNISVELT